MVSFGAVSVKRQKQQEQKRQAQNVRMEYKQQSNEEQMEKE